MHLKFVYPDCGAQYDCSRGCRLARAGSKTWLKRRYCHLHALAARLISETHFDSKPGLYAFQTHVNGRQTFDGRSAKARKIHSWLRDVIGREYVKVDIKPPADSILFNEITTIHPWEELRLSAIRSSAIGIQRRPGEPYMVTQDAYFAVVLLSGRYALEQRGREVFLEPGDMTLYDATRPHRIHCPEYFSKLIVSVPRARLRERITGVEHCTAFQIAGQQAVGAVVSNFLRETANRAGHMTPNAFLTLSDNFLDLLSLAVSSLRTVDLTFSRSRSFSLRRVKVFVERHLADPSLNAAKIASGMGLSPRYINDLFQGRVSLMRYDW